MNKEQLLEKVRSGKLTIEHDPKNNVNSDEELNYILDLIFGRCTAGMYKYYSSTNGKLYFSDRTDLPSIKVREALKILKEPNMEDKFEQIKKRLAEIEAEIVDMKFELTKPVEPPKTAKIGTPKTVGELKKLIEIYRDDATFGFRNQPMQSLYEVKDGDKIYLVFQ